MLKVEIDAKKNKDMDFDLNVDMTSLGTEDQHQLNYTGVNYDLGTRDFVKLLAKVVFSFALKKLGTFEHEHNESS